MVESVPEFQMTCVSRDGGERGLTMEVGVAWAWHERGEKGQEDYVGNSGGVQPEGGGEAGCEE